MVQKRAIQCVLCYDAVCSSKQENCYKRMRTEATAQAFGFKATGNNGVFFAVQVESG